MLSDGTFKWHSIEYLCTKWPRETVKASSNAQYSTSIQIGRCFFLFCFFLLLFLLLFYYYHFCDAFAHEYDEYEC